MKRIIRLTESDLTRIVKRVINENEEEAEIDKLEAANKSYCEGGSMENKLLSKIKSLGTEAKDKLKEIYNNIKGKSIKELFGILRDARKANRDARKANKTSKKLNEELGAVMIAGVSIPGGIFVMIGALIVILIIVTILGKGKRGGCAKNPFSRL